MWRTTSLLSTWGNMNNNHFDDKGCTGSMYWSLSLVKSEYETVIIRGYNKLLKRVNDEKVDTTTNGKKVKDKNLVSNVLELEYSPKGKNRSYIMKSK